MEKEYPELKTRIQSAFIDGILIIVLMFVAAWVLDKIGVGDDEQSGITKAIVFVSIWGVYEPVATMFGATLGNYIMKIRVRKVDKQGKRLNVLQAFVRFAFKFLLGWLSFVTINFDERRRAIHDMVAGSIMLEKNN